MSSNSSNSSDDYTTYLNNLSNTMNNYLSIILPSIGIPCNFISVLIFWRMGNNKSNMVFLGIFQSLVDAVLLFLVLIVFRSQYTIGISFFAQSDTICKLLTFIRRYIYVASSWMHVLITFDRVIFVLNLHQSRLRFMQNKLVLTGLIFVVLSILALLSMPNAFYYLDGTTSTCTSSGAINITTDIVAILFRTYLPFTLMIIFNLIMIQKIFKSSKVKGKQTAVARREYQLTFAVMAFDVYFFFVNFPLSCYFIFYDVNNYSGAMDNNPLFRAQYSLFNTVTSNFAFFQQTFSFVMYMIFNKLFRAEVLGLVGIVLRISSLANRSSKVRSTGNAANTTTGKIRT